MSVGIVLSLVAPLVASLGSLLQNRQQAQAFPGRGPRRAVVGLLRGPHARALRAVGCAVGPRRRNWFQVLVILEMF
jgi:hypothetical protein